MKRSLSRRVSTIQAMVEVFSTTAESLMDKAIGEIVGEVAEEVVSKATTGLCEATATPSTTIKAM